MTDCNSKIDTLYQNALKSEYERLGLYDDNQGVCSNGTSTKKSTCTGSNTWTSYGDQMLLWSKAGRISNRKNYPTKQVPAIFAADGTITSYKSVPIIPQRQNAAIMRQSSLLANGSCYTPCKPNRMGAGRYYGSAANCKNNGTQGSCYMYSYPDPQTASNPNAPVGPNTRRFARNFIPTKANAYGLRLLFNNNKFSLTNSASGRVGTSAGASRAINRGRASARNAAKVSYNNRK